MTYIHLACVLLLACLPGCTSVAPAAADPADYVEYIYGTGRRIYLTAQGGARIDIKVGEGQSQQVRTFFAPAVGKEVERLIRAVSALIDARVAQPINDRELLDISFENPPTMRCRRSGREQTVQVLNDVCWDNRTWQGVIDEMEVVALLGLARAVDACMDADEHERHGKPALALDAYFIAFEQWMEWNRVRSRRYFRGVIVEYQESGPWDGYDVDGARIKGIPEKSIMKAPGMTTEMAVRVCRNASIMITSDSRYLPDGSIILGPVEQLAERLPGDDSICLETELVYLPPAVVDTLKRARWSPPPPKPSAKGKRG